MTRPPTTFRPPSLRHRHHGRLTIRNNWSGITWSSGRKSRPDTASPPRGARFLHCTFGSVLTHATYGPQLRQILQDHAETYREVLRDHFSRHLRALQDGL